MTFEEVMNAVFGGMENIDMLTTREIRFDDFKVIFQNEKTVLKVKDEVYIAKCEKGDEFDPEKGLMVCLLKYLGISTSDLLYLMKKSNFDKSKYSKNHIKSDKKVVDNGKKGGNRRTKGDKV